MSSDYAWHLFFLLKLLDKLQFMWYNVENGINGDSEMANKKTESIRVDEWTYKELTELKELTGVTYGNLVRNAIPLLDKKYKRKKVVKETENGGC